tara:strand:- start:75 stop:365 length:291 start_codon:yes stop_codon:yes gene_type:complete
LIVTSKQKQYLRGLAHSLDPYIIIGKNGLSPSSIKSINKSLTDHELIKVRIKIGNKKDFAPIIEKKTSSTIVGLIGKILILYRQSEDRENSKIILP